MGEPIHIARPPIGMIGVGGLAGLMFGGAWAAFGPMGGVGQGHPQFWVAVEVIRLGGGRIIEVEKEPMRADIEVMGGEAFDLIQGGLDCGDDAPFRRGHAGAFGGFRQLGRWGRAPQGGRRFARGGI